MPRHEGPVAAEHHAVGAHLVEQESQRLLAPDHGVVVETTLVAARRARNRALLGPHALPAAIDAPHREARRAAAVRDADAEVRTRVQDAAEDQHGHDDRVLHDDAKAVEQSVARRALHHEVVLRLRMEEQHRTHRLGGLEEWQESRLVPVLAVDERVELRTLETEPRDRALELVDGELDVLHRERGEAGEARRPLRRHRRDLVVDLAGQLPPPRGIEVIAEERRVDGDDLHVHTLRVHVGDPLFGREANLRRGERDALVVAHEAADALAGLVTEAVPLAAGLGGAPRRARHEMRVDVDALHAPRATPSARSAPPPSRA